MIVLLPVAAPAHAAFLDCLFGGGFEGSAVTNAEVGAAVALHNCARRTVVPPAATPIEPLTWSASIATMAQNYSNQCHYAHSGTSGYGENIYAAAGFTPTMDDAVAAWAQEQSYYNYATNTCSSGKVCGHYTQVVWDTTAQVGCGKTYCTQNSPFGSSFPNWYLVVCNYSPAGNDGSRPY